MNCMAQTREQLELEIKVLRSKWNKATAFGEEQLARREELIVKLISKEKEIAELKEFFHQAYEDARYFESELNKVEKKDE